MAPTLSAQSGPGGQGRTRLGSCAAQEPTLNTLFSHIVQKRLSKEYENIATEGLDFILHSSESARNGLVKLLRGITPHLPSLQFRTQQTGDNARPDMWGLNGSVPRVFIENKFWAGLTKKQPVHYLDFLAKQIQQPTVLLVVVPAAREETMWRELHSRIKDAKVSIQSQNTTAGVRSIEVGRGPILALTSWTRLLSAIETELRDEPQVENDLLQLRGLCEGADNKAFIPISAAELTDQRTPAFVLQLNLIREHAVGKAITAGVLSTKNSLEENPRKGQLLPHSHWEGAGRYVCFPRATGVGAWIGTEFTLWKEQGSTPLWLAFGDNDWQRGSEVRVVLEPWASRTGISSVWRKNGDEDEFAIGIVLETGQEEEAVIASVSQQLENIAEALSEIGPKRK
jgi:hypothetical protein